MRVLRLALPLALLSLLQWPSQDSLGEDSVAVYKSFLADFNKSLPATLNITDRTAYFSPDLVSEHAGTCLKQIHIPAPADKHTHLLDSSIIPAGMDAHLISPDDGAGSLRDPEDAIRHGKSADDAVREGFESGLLTLSEVIFDASHSRAVLSYSFICGRLCGHGGAILFENRNGHWGHAREVCGRWMS